MQNKKIIKRSLPIDTTYEIVDLSYNSVEDGGAICENCGRLISNIATVKSEKYRTFTVGMDCAKTLIGIKDSLELMQAESAFNTAKNARASITKLMKAANEKGVKLIVSAKTFTDDKNFFKQVGAGMYSTESDPFDIRYRTWKVVTKEDWKIVEPFIKPLLNN